MKTKQLRTPFLFWAIFLSLITFSNTAFGCACCGRENTWHQTETTLCDDYLGGMLKTLEIHDGSVSSMDGAVDQNIKSNQRTAQKVEFTLENDTVITLDLNDKVIHKQTDVSFLAKPDSNTMGDAVIYHELVLSGKITLSDTAKTLFKEANLPDSFDVDVVFQGSGNSCLQDNSIQRWMIHPKDNKHDFMAAGSFKSES